MSIASYMDFVDLRSVVMHPRDRDGETVIRHLQRLGSNVEHIWPPPGRLAQDVGLLVCQMDSKVAALLEATAAQPRAPAVVGIIEPHGPETLQFLCDALPHAVIARPIEPVALLANLVLARNNAKFQWRQQIKIAKLEETLRSFRKVEQAKAILMLRRKIAEPEAYSFLREQAMRRRVPIGAVASAVVESHEMLSDDTK